MGIRKAERGGIAGVIPFYGFHRPVPRPDNVVRRKRNISVAIRKAAEAVLRTS